MAKHRRFSVDRFVDKFQGQEPLLGAYVAIFNGRAPAPSGTLDVAGFKKLLAEGVGDGMDDLLEGLYRVYDLCTDIGHEHLVAACHDFGYAPDPDGRLPVECLSLKVRTENEDAFTHAYDRNTLWNAERFTVYRGKEAKGIINLAEARHRLEAKLADTFKGDKSSDRVLVRPYRDGAYTNFVVYHEKRTKAELVFKGARGKERVAPTILRPAQQDFISYNHETGQVEIEARFEHEESTLRTHFAECCLDDPGFFEEEAAAKRFDLSRVAEEDFAMPVDPTDTAVVAELYFQLSQKYGPTFLVRSTDTLETLDLTYMRKRLAGGTIKRVVFKITFPDDKRGKRVELSGQNRIRFKRATHADDVFRYLKDWKILVA